METWRKAIGVGLVGLGLSACDSGPGSETTESMSPSTTTVERSTTSHSEPQGVAGNVRGHDFSISSARLDKDILTLRQDGVGNAAPLEVTLFLFRGEAMPVGETITYDAGGDGGGPHIHLAAPRADGRAIDRNIITQDYTLTLSFGEKGEFGIPFEIDLKVSGEHSAALKGRYLATFSDVRIVNGAIDLQYDGLDTLRHVVRTYKRNKHVAEQVQFGDDFGTSVRSLSGDGTSKIGLVGYEWHIPGGPVEVSRFQLYKDTDGWKVINELAGDQISEAHPLDVSQIDQAGADAGAVDTDEGREMPLTPKVVAAREFEAILKENGDITQVRATFVNCHQNRHLDKTSCHFVYGFKSGSTTECRKADYLLKREGVHWSVESELKPGRKVDFETGKVVDYVQSKMVCRWVE